MLFSISIPNALFLTPFPAKNMPASISLTAPLTFLFIKDFDYASYFFQKNLFPWALPSSSSIPYFQHSVFLSLWCTSLPSWAYHLWLNLFYFYDRIPYRIYIYFPDLHISPSAIYRNSLILNFLLSSVKFVLHSISSIFLASVLTIYSPLKTISKCYRWLPYYWIYNIVCFSQPLPAGCWWLKFNIFPTSGWPSAAVN